MTSPATDDEWDGEEEEDEAEAELMAKMRGARMAQLQTQQQQKAAQAPERTKLGTYTRLRDDESLASLLEESAKYPIVLHVGLVSNSPVEDNLCMVVGQQMSRAAPSFAGAARLVTDEISAAATARSAAVSEIFKPPATLRKISRPESGTPQRASRTAVSMASLLLSQPTTLRRGEASEEGATNASISTRRGRLPSIPAKTTAPVDPTD